MSGSTSRRATGRSASTGANAGTGADVGGGAGDRLRVDPVACDAVGLCARLAPHLVSLDAWGYPRLESRPLDDAGLRTARRAVRACPHRALWFQVPG